MLQLLHLLMQSPQLPHEMMRLLQPLQSMLQWQRRRRPLVQLRHRRYQRQSNHRLLHWHQAHRPCRCRYQRQLRLQQIAQRPLQSQSAALHPFGPSKTHLPAQQRREHVLQLQPREQ